MNNLTLRTPMIYTQITTVSFPIVGGAAGWVDTDVSAVTGTDVNKIWCIQIKNDAFQAAGAKAHGAVVDPKTAISNSTFAFTTVDANGHVDLYREAANTGYYFVGYLS